MNRLAFTTTDSCNLRCKYCYQRPFEYTGKRISQEIVDMAVRLFHRYADRENGEKPTILFVGGEILVHGAQMMQSVADTYGDIFEYQCVTNGTLLTKQKDFVAFVKAHNVRIAVSLDGIQESHDRNRRTIGNEGTHERIMEGIRLLDGYKHLNVNISVTANNVEFFLRNVLFLVKNNIPNISFTVDFFGGMSLAREFVRQLFILHTSVRKACSEKEWENIVSRIHCFESPCDEKECAVVCHNSISIDPSGDVYVCETSKTFFRPFLIGNIMENGEYIFENYSKIVGKLLSKHGFLDPITRNLPFCEVLDENTEKMSASHIAYWQYLTNARKLIWKKYGFDIGYFSSTPSE